MNSDKKSIIIGIAIIIAALILGGSFYQAQKPQHTINVVGVADKKFEADTVKWSISLEATANPDELKQGYETIQQQTKNLIDTLGEAGINTDNINKMPVNVFKEYDFQEKERIFTGYRLQQNFYIISTKIDKIEELAFNPIILLNKDIIINNSNLQYYSSQIDNLKKEIISQATANARERAEKMLENTDVKPGKVLSINSGVFQITEPYSTAVSSSGIYETSTRKKQIRVTVHAIFALK